MKIEEFVGRNKGKIRILAGFALVFVLGFASGYYYLDGNRNTEILTIKDGSADCAALFKSGVQAGAVEAGQNNADAADKDNTADNPAGTAAGAVLGADTAAAPQPGASVGAKAFASSKNSTLYHTRDCQYVKRIKAENLVWFGSKQEAQSSGRKPHSCVKQ
jgi:hypothetical protein